METNKIFFDCPFCIDGTVSAGEGDCPHCNGASVISWGALSPSGENIVYTYEILDATDTAEYNALSDAKKAAYNMILSCGIVDLSEGTQSHTKLWNIFDAESTTRANLIALLA